MKKFLVVLLGIGVFTPFVCGLIKTHSTEEQLWRTLEKSEMRLVRGGVYTGCNPKGTPCKAPPTAQDCGIITGKEVPSADSSVCSETENIALNPDTWYVVELVPENGEKPGSKYTVYCTTKRSCNSSVKRGVSVVPNTRFPLVKACQSSDTTEKYCGDCLGGTETGADGQASQKCVPKNP